MFKERFKDAKRVIKKPLKKEIQHNGQRKTNHTKNQGELMRSGSVSSSCSTCDTHRVTLITKLVLSQT